MRRPPSSLPSLRGRGQSAEQHAEAFLVVVSGLLADLGRYLKGSPDFLRDGFGCHAAAMWVLDAEYAELARDPCPWRRRGRSCVATVGSRQLRRGGASCWPVGGAGFRHTPSEKRTWHDPTVNDEAFVAEVTERLAGLPGVVAVSLGGSRVQGTHRPDSDWDFAVYYRGGFDPQDLRDLGWAGQVFEVGAWGGVFNSGAWLTIEGRRCDVHYRDLAVVEHELDEAAAGRFHVEPLLFHLAGIPTYLVVAELALHRVLSGDLPRPAYPARLKAEAHRIWWARAELTFAYAEQHHATSGRLTSCVGLLAQATTQAAHAVLAGRGRWITNEKGLLAAAGLSDVDTMLAAVDPEPAALVALARSVYERCASEVREAGLRDDEAGAR